MAMHIHLTNTCKQIKLKKKRILQNCLNINFAEHYKTFLENVYI